MKCLVFPSEQYAWLNEGQICVNILRRDWDSIKLVDEYNQVISTFAEFMFLTDEEKRLTKQLGKNAKTLEWDHSGGFTTSYAIPQQIYNDTRFWIPKPDADLMSYLEGYEELDFLAEWNKPMENM